jgi:diguanylate cyclase (GGDEF)-like protein
VHEQLATERANFQRATHTDPLTGVGNRAAWEFAVSTTERSRRYAVLSADLDDLKLINDRYGHSAGDQALRAAANLLRSELRADDVVCRVGGDEFLALLLGAGAREARAAAKRVRAAAAISLDEAQPRLSLSVGWAVVEDDWAAAIHKADERMYDNKRRKDSSARSLPERPAAAALPETAVA